MVFVDPIHCLHCGQITDKDYCCSACEILHSRFQDEKIVVDPDYAFLDQENFRQLYHFKDSKYNYHLFVEGLHCSSCVHLLEQLPDWDPSVLEARVQFGQSRLYLKTTSQFSLSYLSSLLKSWGYQAHFLNPLDNQGQNLQDENRRLLKRIAVAGACAGNIMMFSIPVYSGLAGSWAQSFNWMGFFLFLPLLFYSAQSFYQGAWNSLKYQKMNVDLPILIALWSGFLMSTFNLLKGRDAVYFDSTASFIFLILCARYLLKRVQQNFLRPLEIQDFMKTQNFQREKKGQLESIPTSSIQEGDILILHHGQTLPADAILLDQETLLDLSLLSGESLPRYYHHGMTLLAGAKVCENQVRVRVIESPEKSKLAALLNKINETSLDKIHFISLTDRIAHYLIATVFTSALLFFVIYFSFDFQEAFDRSLALIVLACPCALAFGSPLTLGLALRKAQQKGILIKDGNVFEKILKIKNVFFDKTGTLTDIRLNLLSSEPSTLSEETKSLILGMENGSHHPIAFCLRETWKNHPAYDVHSRQEIFGQGISAQWKTDHYELRTLNDNQHSSSIAITLLKNSELVCTLYFEDPLRPDSRSAIQNLAKEGIESFVLSGDRRSRVQAVARQCGIRADNVFFELFPEDKKEILARYPQSCMIGDGANDSLALKQATVGIAVQGSVQLSLQSADIYFTRGGLTPLLELWQLARQARHILIRNLLFSLVYNLLGAILALSGFINPLLAALLMPVSSMLIIASTLWGFRK